TDNTSESAFAQLIANTGESPGIDSRGLGELVQPGKEQYTEQKLKKLHQLLIAPIADLLPQDPEARVVFIPDQELFFVPFAALQDEEGQYLIDKHTIVSSPSIQVLDLTHKRKTSLTGTTGEALIIGNPKMPPITVVPGEPPEDKLDSLPGTEAEAKTIAQRQGVQPLIGTEATETAVVEKMPQAKLIHFATHGLLNYSENLMPGVIALAPDEKNDGLLSAVDIYNMKLQADLVVLSACNTGLGDITSDGVIGLSRAFFNAGVPSLVVSLWSLPDNPTAPLMTEFYKNLETNPDKAQALRQAMLTRKEVDPNPLNWAGFMLLGEAE
ncbi:MAG: CHAT domain-containing protein, partial [Spirulinaceae cyanobacterium]